ncbi:MAG: PLP-dependent aminotransferase family protein [Lachnospiraceae bacterium]|nr:PLP-dependent aminotransferase family protein [Lachnospiraceae bacterium]
MLTYDLAQKGKYTIYEYLYQCIKRDILDGVLHADERLPSKRELAKHHQISLKTVENTYEQLLTEGYIYAEEKRGYFVMPLGTESDNRSSKHERHVPFSVYQGDVKEEQYFADFTSNQSVIEKFPFGTWAKTMRNVLTEKDTLLLETVSFQGIFELRQAIAKYLYAFRGMQVSPDQIVIGAGTEYLYGRLIQLLGREHIYAVEDPGYQKIMKIYQAHGVPWEYVSVDENGMQIDKLYESGASVVHVSPGHHFPTGSIMPIARRKALLEWAEQDRERYIIEDDYDSEFRFSRRPVPAIQSINHNHRVIYLNTFSKTLAPSIRISYMVLPRKLMECYVNTMNFYSCTVSAFEQYTMAEFMNKGYFERHIHRMKKYYKEKRDSLLKVLEESPLQEYVTIDEKDAGNHFLMKVHTSLSDTELKWYAREHGIKLDCLSEYCVRDKEAFAHTIIVNYSDLEEENFRKALQILWEGVQ